MMQQVQLAHGDEYTLRSESKLSSPSCAAPLGFGAPLALHPAATHTLYHPGTIQSYARSPERA